MNFGYEEPYFSPHGVTLQRHIAGSMDCFIASILAVFAAKQVDAENIPMQAVIASFAFLGYYFLFEVATSRSIGKLLTGLKVVDFDGERCSVKQVAIRTLFRLVEVNPLLLGATPAAMRILWSRNKQRFGDKVANTVVVRAR